MKYFPWTHPEISTQKDVLREKIFCIPVEFMGTTGKNDYLSRSWPIASGQFYDCRANLDLLKKYKFATLPSRSLIDQVGKVIGKDLSLDDVSVEQLEQYNQYNFIADIVAFMGEIRWQAEDDSRSCRDELYWRLDYDLPLPWKKVCGNFKTCENDPPMELIVQIAINYGPKLFELAHSPRKILRQQLRKEHLSRVQQIDNRCMIWLTRQPGNSTVQKAGSRQQILAVVRQENHDTLENKVLKNMLSLCCSYATNYYHRYKSGKYKNHERLNLIMRFALETNSILKNSVFAQIGNLQQIPKPNYVLRFDRHYKEMWYWYQRLVRQQEETEIAWQWQHRLFSDWCHLAITAATYDIGCAFYDHRLWVRCIAQNSSWFSFVDWPSPLVVNGKIIEIMLPSMRDAPDIVGKVGADMLITIVDQGVTERKWLFIWTIHVFTPSNAVPKLFKNHIATLRKKISGEIKGKIAGLVISSNYSSGGEILSDIKIEDGMMVASLVVNGQNQNMPGCTVREIKKILNEFIKL